MTKQARVFLVDDHPIVQEGMVQLINRVAGLTVVGQAFAGHDALERLKRLIPDIVVLDLSMDDLHGLDLIKMMRERHPRLPILVLSMHDEEVYAERALRAGARGYIMKQEAPEKLIDALRCVLSGQVYLSDRMRSELLMKVVGREVPEGSAGVESLTDRELQVFQMLGEGRTTRMIAEKIHLSVKTVETHRKNIKQKLKLATANALIERAVVWVRSRQ